MKMILKQQM